MTVTHKSNKIAVLWFVGNKLIGVSEIAFWKRMYWRIIDVENPGEDVFFKIIIGVSRIL